MNWKNQEKKTGPHPDCLINFAEWDKWIMQPSFRKQVGHCTIWEYYILPNNQIYKHEMWDGEKKLGRKRKNNRNKDGELIAEWDIPVTGKPLYVLFSWKDPKKGVCCCDLNFHQPVEEFRRHMEYYFPVANVKEQEYEAKYMNW